jgi:2-iminoacetate synthase
MTQSATGPATQPASTAANHEPRVGDLTSSELDRAFEAVKATDVERALQRDHLDARDVIALLSPKAADYLEPLAQKSQWLTRQRFGRTMQLYAPLYLSNECVNRCTYCGFSQELGIARRTLSIESVVAEAEHLYAEGFRHLLLVSGEAPRIISLDYLEAVARALRPRFDSLSIEIGTFDLAGYQRLVAAGYDGLTLYQETYLDDVYRRVHLAGPKHHAGRRRQAVEFGGTAGFRSLGLGALLGLGPWRHEAYALSLHASHLTQRFWRSRIAISFPRIRENAGGRLGTHAVSDTDLVQMICAMRLLHPDAELVLSTREPAWLRDRLMDLGITRMSAGSRTNPGGYTEDTTAGEQFSIEDERPAAEIARLLEQRGFEAVWKDFDRGFLPATAFPLATAGHGEPRLSNA